MTSTGPRQADFDGFDLHANLAVPAEDRARLEQLCRYLLRPPVAQDRLRLTGDGRVRLTLKTPWADGTRPLTAPPTAKPLNNSGDERLALPANRRYWAWASLMRRAFDVDVLACPRCGGRLRLIATIDDPRMIREILASLALPTEGANRAPPHLPPVPTGDPVTTVPA